MNRQLRNAFIWTGLIGGTCSCTSYTGLNSSPQTVITVKRDKTGTFSVPATVNGKRMLVLLDTGASAVGFSMPDAEELGFDPTKKKFTGSMDTSAGAVPATSFIVGHIEIGRCVFTDVWSMVAGVKKSEPVIGMNVLSLMREVTITGDTLTMDCDHFPRRSTPNAREYMAEVAAP